jgi:hypothetical protein
MQTMPGEKRNGLWRDCVLVLAIFGRDVTPAEIREFMRAEGKAVSTHQVRQALAGLAQGKRPLVERAAGIRVRGVPSWYRLTERGHAVLAEE